MEEVIISISNKEDHLVSLLFPKALVGNTCPF
jgi:hypothetical protein